MRILGLPIPFTGERQKALTSVSEGNGGWLRIFESFPGAWQSNVTIDRNLVLSYHAVYACMTLIASDISKMRLKLVERTADDIWIETKNSAYTPVLRKPNTFQNRIQFYESWVLSKLMRGNTYVLKHRDNRGVVTGMTVLDPQRVVALVSDAGEVFYQLNRDNIAGLPSDIIVPAREIIHDRFNCLFHPLVGTSPLFASGIAAMQGLTIQENSTKFFENRSMPGGILTAPGAISDETAGRLKAAWDANYAGANRGKLAVLGDGLEFKTIAMTAEDSQLIEQLKLTAEIICSVFHVPPYKIGIGAMPSYNNIQALNVEYYSQALQKLIEDIELSLDEGLATGDGLGTEFDLDGLLRMDTVTQVTAARDAVGAGFMSPNEARRRFDLPPVMGGKSPYLQQQNYSLEALAKRDAENPLALPPPPPPAPTPLPEPDEEEVERAWSDMRSYANDRVVKDIGAAIRDAA